MAASMHQAWLQGRSGKVGLQLEVADGFWSRFKGLMLRRDLPERTGLLLRNCTSVHTAWMRFSIDLVYLARDGRVLGTREHLAPWRASAWSRQERLAAQGPVDILELPSGSVKRWQIMAGDTLLWAKESAPSRQAAVEQGKAQAWQGRSRERGAAMVEFAVVGPMLILVGLASVQYGLLYNAKNVINHASFMAARAGAMGNARIESVSTAYVRALVPLYGGGRNVTEIAESLGRAAADFALNSRIELVNPTRESFEDWNDPRLQTLLATGGKRVIPNRHLARHLGDRTLLEGLGSNHNVQQVNGSFVKARSGQSLADANLLKIRVTHGYRPSVPLMGSLYTRFLRWMDTGQDPYASALIQQGRIPVVSHVTVQMLTDAIEGANVSSPGMGNGGTPQDPGTPPQTTEPPPACNTMGCSNPQPTDPGGGGDDGGGGCSAGDCPSCPVQPSDVSLPADILFAFNQSELLPQGKAELDRLIAEAKEAQGKGQSFDGVSIRGHTDQLGSDAVNQPLSQRRAQAVADYLVANGFPGKNLKVEGLGSSEPVVQMSACEGKGDEALRTCLAPNRRVVLHFP